jgi:hypothetical protein
LALLPELRRVNLAWNRLVGCALKVPPAAQEPSVRLPSSPRAPLNRALSTRGESGSTLLATAAAVAAVPLPLAPVLHRGLSSRQSFRGGGGNDDGSSRSALRGLAVVESAADIDDKASRLLSVHPLGDSVRSGDSLGSSTQQSCLAGAKPLTELYLADNPQMAFPKGAACFGRRACRALAALRMVPEWRPHHSIARVIVIVTQCTRQHPCALFASNLHIVCYNLFFCRVYFYMHFF